MDVALRARRPWWRNAVVYQIYVRSFADTNGDGRGDLDGVIRGLPHVRALGADAIWLNPCYPSPQLDHGYDVSDYFDIDPSYGDLATFDRLVATARDLGLRVLMDVVPNHCSAQHDWFRAALRAGPGSPERARFWFRDGRGPAGAEPPNNWTAVFGGPAWSRVTEADGSPGQWYLHTFTPAQPDFDWNHPDVAEHFDRMLEFWFDRGVDGFRVDAVTVVGKHPELPDAPPAPPGTPENDLFNHNPHTVFVRSAHDHWRRWRSLIDRYEREHPGRQLVTVGEAYAAKRPDLLARFVAPDQFHQAFCFDLMLCPWDAAWIHEAIEGVSAVLDGVGATPTWTLNNHDTQRAVTRYGRADAASPDSWTGSNLVYTGTPVDLDLGTRRARAMIAFVAGLPGSLYLYQGEELGLPEVLDLPDGCREDPIFEQTEGRQIGRDGCRVPLPWTERADGAHGFAAVEIEPWLPQPADWGGYAVDRQQADPGSMLSHYRAVLAARRTLDHDARVDDGSPDGPSSTRSGLEWLEASGDVLVYRRGDVVVVLSLGTDDIVIGDIADVELAGLELVLASADGASTDRLPANSCAWFRRGSS